MIGANCEGEQIDLIGYIEVLLQCFFQEDYIFLNESNIVNAEEAPENDLGFEAISPPTEADIDFFERYATLKLFIKLILGNVRHIGTYIYNYIE